VPPRPPAGKPVGQSLDQLGGFQRGRPQHDTLDAVVEQAGGVGLGAHPPAHLEAHVQGAGHVEDDGPVHGNAGAGGIEVDHVDPARASRHVAARQFHGLTENALAVEVALHEAHRRAVA
jgi:hypothetical protein